MRVKKCVPEVLSWIQLWKMSETVNGINARIHNGSEEVICMILQGYASQTIADHCQTVMLDDAAVRKMPTLHLKTLSHPSV